MTKVVIIGAGIAGLTCGVYAQMNGFDTHIYEMHTIPGGECTGWDRSGYHFDGCIHWLMGSKPGSDLNDMWRTTGALGDDVQIIDHDIFARYEEGDNFVNLYTNADKLEKHLLEISLQDKKEIKKLCKAIRVMGDFGMPIGKPMDQMTMGDGLKFAGKNISKLGLLNFFNNIKLTDYVKLYKEPLLQQAFLQAIPGDYNASALVMSMAGMNVGDAGYPEGGSRALAKRMEQKYLALGGQITYKSRVEKIIIENGEAKGIKLSGGEDVMADIVISCADAYATLYKMLGNKYTPELYRNLFENPKKHYAPTCSLVFMGVDCDIKDGWRGLNFLREQPVNLNGQMVDSASLLNYSYDKTLAPAGKTVMAAFYTAEYEYWNEVSKDKEAYKQEKERLKQDAIDMLIKRYPQAKGKIEVTDVVTPMTYVRYCDAWRGSWMSWGDSGKDIPRYFPGKLEGLENFLLAGMWTLPPGGLPGASASGRFAAHRITQAQGREFITK
jgi:phytoene dehydrogenase-like protein